jgi:hypothetical protein
MTVEPIGTGRPTPRLEVEVKVIDGAGASAPPTSGVTEDEARLWAKAEDVAMHFNEMIMNFRLRALGGITLAGGLVGTVLLKGNGPPSSVNLLTFGGAMALLAVLWRAIHSIDDRYYQKLLLGAVDDLIRLEAQSDGRIQLSTLIEKRVAGAMPEAVERFYQIPTYALVVTATLAGILAACRLGGAWVGIVLATGAVTYWSYGPGLSRSLTHSRTRKVIGIPAALLLVGILASRLALPTQLQAALDWAGGLVDSLPLNKTLESKPAAKAALPTK